MLTVEVQAAPRCASQFDRHRPRRGGSAMAGTPMFRIRKKEERTCVRRPKSLFFNHAATQDLVARDLWRCANLRDRRTIRVHDNDQFQASLSSLQRADVSNPSIFTRIADPPLNTSLTTSIKHSLANHQAHQAVVPIEVPIKQRGPLYCAL